MQTQELRPARAARRPRLRVFAIAIPFLLYLAHAALYRHWLIDDAGISFAYARNLAQGHGLVPQPGVAPIEGYSNPLWVFLLALCFRLHLFHLYLTPKLLALPFVLWTYLSVHRFLGSRSPRGEWATLVILSLLSACPPFVIWTTSGLENALYVALLISFAWQLMVVAEAPATLRASSSSASPPPPSPSPAPKAQPTPLPSP